MKMNVIGGLPRSGSTLLCNILNQNPAFYASSTSCLPGIISMMISVWSNSPEFKGLLADNQQEANARLRRSIQSFCESWYQRGDGKNVIFDKSRGWNHNIMAFKSIFPEGKALITVRDLKNVMASVEKQHSKMPLLDNANSPIAKSLFRKAEEMLSPNGMIGAPLEGVLDLVRRQQDVLFIRYEALASRPAAVMQEVYAYLEEPFFEHDFNNVKNTAKDLDVVYNFKYPHKGSGKITPPKLEEYKLYMNPEVANAIDSAFPAYNSYFGYGPPPQTNAT
jgi:sulfotransferase